jgi:CheY-like chemotaxis protein
VETTSILLAEDNRLSRELASSFLEEHGFSFGIAINGQEAFEKFSQSDFKLILLDIEMPLLNGYEVAKKIRATGSAVPIIAMTGHESEKEKAKCISAGINDCISKPFDKEKLHSLIAAYLHLPSSLPPRMESPVLTSPRHGVTDLTHLRSISKGRKVFFLSMIEIFLEQNQEDMQALEKAISETNFETIHLLSHKIATSIIFMGLEKHIYAQLKEMERLGEGNTSIEKIKKLFAEVAAVCAKAEEELKLVKDIE